MNIKSQFLDQPKFQDKHEHAIFFNKKWDKVCVNVSPNRCQILHIGPPLAYVC